MRVLLIKSFSVFLPLWAAPLKTVMPKDLVACYGVVPSVQATNYMNLQGANHACDPYGFVLLLRYDCAALLRGYTANNVSRHGCVGDVCEYKDVPSHLCAVNKTALMQAQERARDAMIEKPKKKKSLVYKKESAFGPIQKSKRPFLTNY